MAKKKSSPSTRTLAKRSVLSSNCPSPSKRWRNTRRKKWKWFFGKRRLKRYEMGTQVTYTDILKEYERLCNEPSDPFTIYRNGIISRRKVKYPNLFVRASKAALPMEELQKPIPYFTEPTTIRSTNKKKNSTRGIAKVGIV